MNKEVFAKKRAVYKEVINLKHIGCFKLSGSPHLAPLSKQEI